MAESAPKLYDKTGREIMPGDVLKVFHFRGARRKRHYMYKQALRVELYGIDKTPFLEIGHLDLSGEYYSEMLNGRILEHYEIVQGFGDNGEYDFDTAHAFQRHNPNNKQQSRG